MPASTLRRISMKALARYQVILLGEQRHIRCEQLAQGCCPNIPAWTFQNLKQITLAIIGRKKNMPHHSFSLQQHGSYLVVMSYFYLVCVSCGFSTWIIVSVT